MRCGFIAEHRSCELSLIRLCKLVNVAKSSYYDWCSKSAKRKLNVEEEKALFSRINKVFIKSRKTYGVPRIWRAVLREGYSCTRRQVSYIMRKNKLISVYSAGRRKFIVTTNSSKTKSIAENILNREFYAKAPNEKWAGDVTFIRTSEGWLYLAVIIDLYSRKVVGYALSKNNDANLACSAFKMALARRRQPRHLIYHSDRGSIYVSGSFKELLANNEITPSMSRRGNCWDNAVCESFFDTLKVEVVHRRIYKLRTEAEKDIINWIEDFYNSTRMHSSIKYCSPDEFEEIFNKKTKRV